MTSALAPRPALGRSLVVASALDPRSDGVVATAWRLAEACGLELVLAHAVPPPHLTPGVPPDAASLAELSEQAALQLTEQQARLRPPGAHGGATTVISGPADLVIGRLATELRPELIVVGATTTHGRLGKLLGSTAERLLQTATVPVLVVRDELPVPPHAVLAPLDLSLFSTDALRCGARLLARLASGARGDGGPAMQCELLTVVPPAAGRAATELALGRAQERLERLAAELRAPGLNWTPRVLAGEPRDQILRTLEEIAYDLVLMGTHGAGGMRRTLGTVATDVAREAPSSVLLVPPPAALGEALAQAVDQQLAPRWGIDEDWKEAR